MKTHVERNANTLWEPPFLIAVALLATAAFGIGPRLLGDVGPKLEVPLKLPLAQLDKDKLAPYAFRAQVDTTPAVVEVLGTEQFIDWRLDDTSRADRSDPTSGVRFTVSYYSGGRDQVPHVPDQCMTGAGYTAKIKENIEIEVPALGRSIPVRVLTFEKTAIMDNETPTVAYFFVCNGDFVCTRDGVRLGMNSPLHEHAYFAKIEVSFGFARRVATREESIAATRRFLNVALPVLLENHLPDWDEVVRQEKAARKGEDKTT